MSTNKADYLQWKTKSSLLWTQAFGKKQKNTLSTGAEVLRVIVVLGAVTPSESQSSINMTPRLQHLAATQPGSR